MDVIHQVALDRDMTELIFQPDDTDIRANCPAVLYCNNIEIASNRVNNKETIHQGLLDVIQPSASWELSSFKQLSHMLNTSGVTH